LAGHFLPAPLWLQPPLGTFPARLHSAITVKTQRKRCMKFDPTSKTQRQRCMQFDPNGSVTLSVLSE